jgi:gluconolactonase
MSTKKNNNNLVRPVLNRRRFLAASAMAGSSNGNTFDLKGRQISFEHGSRSVVRYEYDGSTTVLASEWQGKPLNAPNDGVVHPDGSVWFTDPGYGSMSNYEGTRRPLEQKEAVYRFDPETGEWKYLGCCRMGR